MTAQDPAGPWSEPYWLGDVAQGIDPSLLFDDDGRCYYVETALIPQASNTEAIGKFGRRNWT